METKKTVQQKIVQESTTAQPTTYSLGLIKVVEWTNERVNKDGTPFKSVTYNTLKSYKTDKDEWRDTSTFSKEELVKLHTLIGMVLNIDNVKHLRIRGDNQLDDVW